MKLRVTILAAIQVIFGAIVFSTNYWPVPMATMHTALYVYGIIAVLFGVATVALLKPAFEAAKQKIISLAVLQAIFGALVFSTNYWPAPMSTKMNAIYFYGIIAVFFGVATTTLLKPAFKTVTRASR